MIEKKNEPVNTRVTQRKQGRAEIRNVKIFGIGGGDDSFGIDKNGFWVGAKSFFDAPFRVTMQGVASGISIVADTLATAASGLRMKMNGSTNSYEFLNDDTVLVEMVSTTVPFSGSGGAAIRHGTGAVMLEVSGNGLGLGSQQVFMVNADASVYFGIINDVSLNTFIVAHGLPTSASGLDTGTIWNDGGTLKIVT